MRNFFDMFLRARRALEFSHSQDPSATSARYFAVMHGGVGAWARDANIYSAARRRYRMKKACVICARPHSEPTALQTYPHRSVDIPVGNAVMRVLLATSLLEKIVRSICHVWFLHAVVSARFTPRLTYDTVGTSVLEIAGAKMDHLRRLTIRLTAVALFGMLPQAGSAAEPQPPSTWGGLGFGIGIATDFNLSGGTRLNDATAVSVVPATAGGIVRVNDARNVGVGVVLEAHYFLRDYLLPFGQLNNCPKPAPGITVAGQNTTYLNCTELGHGPFVAVEVGSGIGDAANKGPVTAYALGWMVGMRHPNSSATPSNTSWNFGVGFRIQPGATFLGEGIVANQPLPPGEAVSPVRTRTGPAYGVMLLSSFGFSMGAQ